tara:strand:- start:15825 stop:16529 length:705 start_codon:yes stop_codon:yes gene_type:complete
METIIVKDLGLIDYKKCWDFQEKIHQSIIKIKKENKDKKNKTKTKNYLILCEHPHVFTLGKNGNENHLLSNKKILDSINASFYKINRGGDITYHGPGQIVGYPIFDLDNFFTDIGLFLRTLEELIIKTLQKFNIKGERSKGETGVWLNNSNPKKICAMGIRASRWVTMHGFALNANTDLSYFKHIIPCGIKNKSITSISCETNKKTDIDFLKKTIIDNFSLVFNSKIEYEKSVI